MVPKEKARELVNAMLENVQAVDQYNLQLGSMNLYNAKQCALVALRDTIWGYLDQQPIEIQNYWQQVKQEIVKL